MLTDRICGDLQTYPISQESFDLIVCWDVLEHLPRPADAVRNMVMGLRPGGTIILGLPNPASFKGLATKFTPLGFHIWAYRTLWKSARAGTEDRGPFRTYMRSQLLPWRLRTLLEDIGCEIVYLDRYESAMQLELRRRYTLVDWLLGIAGFAIATLSRHKIDPNLTDLVLVARRSPSREKPPEPRSRATG